MRTSERLRKYRQFVYDNLCRGREMKAPAPDGDIRKIVRQEPQTYLFLAPTRKDISDLARDIPPSAVPSIVVMPAASFASNIKEGMFDLRHEIKRSYEMGQQLVLQNVFSVWEDGIRQPGFLQKLEDTGEMDMSLVADGTEDAALTLMNWMDDYMYLMLGTQTIPGTDMMLEKTTMTYSLYTDQQYLNDKRPVYYGYVNATFYCHADAKPNRDILDLIQ